MFFKKEEEGWVEACNQEDVCLKFSVAQGMGEAISTTCLTCPQLSYPLAHPQAQRKRGC